MSIYKCLNCGASFSFGEIAHLGGHKVTRKEYLDMKERKSSITFRCPKCNGNTFVKEEPEEVRTVKAR